jgi:hypothetical protein
MIVVALSVLQLIYLMVQMKTTSNNAKKILDQLHTTVEELFTFTGMLRGSIITTHRRCGKKNCWCAQPGQKGHPSTRLAWADVTGSKTRSIHDEELNEIEAAVEQYRSFKLLRKNLRNDKQSLENVLDEFESQMVDKNRHERGYV